MAVTPDIANLPSAIEDARRATLDSDPGPADPLDFNVVLGQLTTARSKFPSLYVNDFVAPLLATLQSLGQARYAQIIVNDPQKQREAGLMFDCIQAVLQRGSDYAADATNAFQQMIDDLYDGFLSAEDRKGVAPPENATDAPLVKWGNPDNGPYTWPIDATRNLGVRAGVVNMPPSHARRALLGWAALAHEDTGHDVLHAYEGLEGQLAQAVHQALLAQGTDLELAGYWADRIDETASDVMGLLNLGPAAGIGLIGYFRGINAAFTGNAVLRADGPANDPHPADVARGYLAASVVSKLASSQAAQWSQVIKSETDKDVATAGDITILGTSVSQDDLAQSADIVASTIVGVNLPTLEGHSLGYIQNWQESDDRIVDQVRQVLRTSRTVDFDQEPRIYAAHVVAAAVFEAVAADGDPAMLFTRLLGILDQMHKKNPTWGPLSIRHPGNLMKNRAYDRSSF